MTTPSTRARKKRNFVWRFLVRLVSFRIFFSILLVVAIPFVIFGALHSWTKTENRVEEWVPASFEETQKFFQFLQIFGGDELLILSWDDCELDDARLEEFQRKLLEPIEIDGEQRRLFRAAITADQLYRKLTDAPYNFSDEEARERLGGFLTSQDGRLAALVALISQDGLTYRRKAVTRVWEIADEISDLGRDSIHVGGSTTDSVSIDDVCRNRLIEMNVLTYLIGIGILIVCFHNVRVAFLVFSISFLNQQICLALIYYLGITFDSILMLAVNLTFVLSLSCCVHLTNYYFAARAVLPPKLAVYKMLKDALVPISGSVTTTLVGLFSLQSGMLIPTRRFSAVAAFALAIATCVVVVYISVHFLLFPLKQSAIRRKKKSSYPKYSVRQTFWGGSRYFYVDNSSESEEAESTFIERFGNATRRIFSPFSIRFPWATLVLTVAAAFVFGYGATLVHTSVGLRNSLKPSTRPIRDYSWLEENFGPLIPVETMIKTPANDDKKELVGELYELADLTEALVAALPDATIISALNFLPTLPDANVSSFRASMLQTAFASKFYNERKTLEESGYFREVDGSRYFRITVRTFAMRDVDYAAFTAEIDRVVKETLAASKRAESSFQYGNVLITGSVPVVQRVQEQLIKDLQTSFVFAFFTIGIVLAVIYRSVICGALAVFPCIFPCLIVFGLVGFSGLKIEMGTMLTGSAALGVAADNIVHFVAWFRIGSFQHRMTRCEAVKFAYQRCGLAMFETTAVCVLGLSAYMLSDFIPTVYFSIFMSALLSTALLAVYTILPAILVLPTGEFFLKDRKKKTTLQVTASDEITKPQTSENLAANRR